jgi:hypothetical protein
MVAEWVGAVATVGAVVVALFGPDIREWRKRPKLMVTADPVGTFASYSRRGMDMLLRVHNEHGRDSAEGVEAFLTMSGETGADLLLGLADSDSLDFHDPRARGRGKPTARACLRGTTGRSTLLLSVRMKQLRTGSVSNSRTRTSQTWRACAQQ